MCVFVWVCEGECVCERERGVVHVQGEGVEFPPIDLDVLAPIATPQRVSVCVCVGVSV